VAVQISAERRRTIAWCLGYAGGATAWIFLSDQLLLRSGDPSVLIFWSTVKGLAFVAVTTALLAMALRHRDGSAQLEKWRMRRTARLGGRVAAAAACFIVAISAICALFYVNQAQRLVGVEMERLQSIAQLKSDETERWLQTRRSAVRTFFNTPRTGADVVLARLARHDSDADAAIVARMRVYASNFGFSEAMLTDSSGKPILGTGPLRSELDPSEMAALEAARSTPDHIGFVDLHRSTDGSLRLGFVSPIWRADDPARDLVGALVFRLDPRNALYPLVGTWPQSSSTGEAFLVERQGDMVEYLSELRRRPNAVLEFSKPMHPGHPASEGLAHGAGVGQGFDYAHRRVLAAMRPVEGSPWVLVAKIDQDEAFAEIRRVGCLTGLILAGVLAAMGAATYALYRDGQLHAAKAELELRDYLGAVAQTMPGALVSMRSDADGSFCFPYASARFADVCGVDPTRVVDDAEAFFAVVHQNDAAALRAELLDSAREIRMMSIEFRIDHPKKGRVWVEARAMPENTPDRGAIWHGLLLDVTGRKANDEQLRLADTVYRNADEGIMITDSEERILSVNPAFTAITGWRFSEVVGKRPSILRSGRQDRAFYDKMWEDLRAVGVWHGDIWNRRKNGEIYPQWTSISAVAHGADGGVDYVAILRDLSGIRKSESRIEYLAHFDPLTNLPNRQLLRARLDQAVARVTAEGRMCAVVFMKLDRFDAITDSLAPSAGDRLLLEVAAGVRKRLKDADTLARVGSDEFVALLESVSDGAEISRVCNGLLDVLAQPLALPGGQEAVVGGNIGVAMLPDDGPSSELLLRHAQTALNQSRRKGEGHCVFYSAPLTEAAVARLELEAKLRHALVAQQFVLHYQPLVSVRDGATKGAEALLRWRGADGALASPGRFIPLAEETGLIVPIGEWALAAACRQMRSWLDDGLDLEAMAVNLSPVQFRDPALLDFVADTLRDTGLAGDRLELEITEGALVEDVAAAEATMSGLRRLGVRLAIDDFGTGYSSLAYLKRFPIDKLKIDRSFIRDLPHDDADCQIATAVIAMARSLGLEALAEGVETSEQLDFLRARGCTTAQGFLFSPALEPEMFVAWVRARMGRFVELRRANGSAATGA
jgi:diguanylate cyclase (GGDEF)-like protein/PAS domain S-box-containing protein